MGTCSKQQYVSSHPSDVMSDFNLHLKKLSFVETVKIIIIIIESTIAQIKILCLAEVEKVGVLIKQKQETNVPQINT